jgi:DnaJ like chaperone protein
VVTWPRMPLILICAIVGFWLGGPNGLFLGAAIGYALNRVGQGVVGRGLVEAQSQFFESTFAVMGALCKADGVVTREEIQVTEEVFVRLSLSPEQKEAARAAFTRGKAADFDLEAEVDKFLRSSRGGLLFPLFLQVQLSAVAADGQVHPAERAMLIRVARRLGLDEGELARLEALLRAAADGGAAASSGPPPKQRLDDAYAAIGVSVESSEIEIKRAYRKLMSENHPDKLAAKGLPESMRQLAEERAREINVAYDLIRKARQFT